MKHDIMEGLLEMICNASMGRVKKDDITFDGVKTYCYFLKSYPDSLIVNVLQNLAGTWEKHKLPPVAVISRLCEEQDGGGHASSYDAELAENERVYKQRKNRHRAEVVDFVKRILGDQPLSLIQQERKETIAPYMENFHGERNLKQELKDLQTPYSWSYTGLYMDALEGKLKKLTGIKQGNLY